MGVVIPAHAISLAWSPDGNAILTGDSDRKTRIWNRASGKLQQVFSPSSHMCVPAFSPDGRWVAAPDSETVRIWDTNSGQLRFTLDSPGGFAVTWRPDGHCLAAALGSGNLDVWDFRTQAKVRSLAAHNDWAMSVAWNPDGTRIATGGADHAVRIWDDATGEKLLTLDGHTDKVTYVNWSPDGLKLASASWNNVVRIWDATRGDSR